MVSETVRSRWRPSPVVYGPGPGVQVGLAVASAVLLFLFILMFTRSTVIVAAGLVATTVAVATWRWPQAAAVVVVFGCSVHQFAMLLLLHFTHSTSVVKVAQLWKEGVVLILLAVGIERLLRGRVAPRVYLIDLGVAFFVLYSTIYLFYPSPLGSLDFTARLFGWRLDTFAFLAYFAGRGLYLNRRHTRWLVGVFAAIVFVIAVIAFVEFSAPGATNAFFDSLGQKEFFALSLGDATTTNAVRANTLAGVLIPRASSLLLSDLGLAFYMLIGVPLAAGLFVTSRNIGQRFAYNAMLLSTMACTALTVTRSVVLALIPILGAAMLLTRQFFWFLLVAAQSLIGMAVILRYMNISPAVIQVMFSSNEGSTRAHLDALDRSIDVIQHDPFGLGLGSAGLVSQRFEVMGGITNESWYFQMATEMGIAGMVIWALVLLGFGIVALKRFRQAQDPWSRTLCLTMLGATIGFALVSLGHHAWQALTTSIIFWLLGGIVVAMKPADGMESHDGPHLER